MYDARDFATYKSKWYKKLDEHRMKATIALSYYNEEIDDDIEEDIELPIKFDVCLLCDGKGSHVNPSIDSHGISAEEWNRDWDDESRDMYMSGSYDVSCYECKGKRVIPTIDDSNLNETEKKHYEILQNNIEDDLKFARISYAERMMGA